MPNSGVIAADRLVKIPDGISDSQAAAMMLKGMTAEYLLRRTYKVKTGDILLCHAAAGGVGLILGQWARHLGAEVIGTAGSADKVELALENGYGHVINYLETDFVAEVKRITGGELCDVVYDSVGKDTFPGSLDCLKPFGLFVSFGQSSGPIPPFNLQILSQKGSLYATRPTLFTYNAKREALVESARALFEVVSSGAVDIKVNQTYSLRMRQRRMPIWRRAAPPAPPSSCRSAAPPANFLKLFQGALRFALPLVRAYDGVGNKKSRLTRWEALWKQPRGAKARRCSRSAG